MEKWRSNFDRTSPSICRALESGSLPYDYELNLELIFKLGVCEDEADDVLANLEEAGYEAWAGLLTLESKKETTGLLHGDKLNGSIVWNAVLNYNKGLCHSVTANL